MTHHVNFNWDADKLVRHAQLNKEIKFAFFIFFAAIFGLDNILHRH